MVTPKQKADELVATYNNTVASTFYGSVSVRCAIIAVDEILNEFPQGFNGNFEERRKQFWLEVKDELKKL